MKYEVTLAIGVPLTAIVMKKGIYKFCSTKAKSKKKMNLKEVIENKSLKKKKSKKKNKKKK